MSEFEQVITLLTAVLTFAGYIVKRRESINQAPQRLSLVGELSLVAVRAAEKLMEGTAETGPEKYRIASDYLVAAAKRVGIKLKPEEVAGFIHDALARVDQFETLDLLAVPPAPTSEEF